LGPLVPRLAWFKLGRFDDVTTRVSPRREVYSKRWRGRQWNKREKSENRQLLRVTSRVGDGNEMKQEREERTKANEARIIEKGGGETKNGEDEWDEEDKRR
jgi:hypothetical protein